MSFDIRITKETRLSPGKSPFERKETGALVSLIQKLEPKLILSMHSPMACIDAP